ncbi:MAG: hypothetical protein ABJG47_12170 [Ekhidna sp.]
MINSALHIIQKRWKIRIFLKCLAWTLLIVGLVVLMNMLGEIQWYWIAGLSTLFILFIVLELRRLPSQEDLISLVNKQYDPAEYSTDLLFQTPTGELQSLQQARVNAALAQQLPTFQYPVYWRDLLMVGALLIVSLTGYTLLSGFTGVEGNDSFVDTKTTANGGVVPSSDSTFLSSFRLYSSPPAYTGMRTKKHQSFDLSVPEQSAISWELKFNGEPQAVWLRFSSGDSLVASLNKGTHKVRIKTLKSSLYTLNYMDKDGQLISSPYYELNVIPDEKPEIVVTGIPPFQRLDYRKNLRIDLNVSISDDYGLTSGYIVATITKGSGESVKFREQKISFPRRVQGRKIVYPVSFDLDELDMEPGNELYFYVTAFDNKQPTNQQARTDTYFIILTDTTEVEFSLQGALGVDLMPDFFRSQLQIIIDTKKLIEEKKQLSAHDFNSKSNALGYDQKQLRLKYGQFIGEEEDSGLEVAEEPVEPGAGEDVLTEFGHDTDAENEEGQWMDRGTEADDHDHEHEDAAEENSLLEQFMHNHEDEETATFYTQSLKSKLRAALNEMWDAELYLRLYEPHKSLPYQMKAHELLKEIRNHARIYVQRIGFDPPPVNVDESRLTGKLKKLNQNPFEDVIESEMSYPSIRKAIQWIDEVRFKTIVWDANAKAVMQAAGDELAGLAVENPGKYLTALNQLKTLLGKEQLDETDTNGLTKLKNVMEAAIPQENTLPLGNDRAEDAYTEAFIESLTNSGSR